MKKVEYITKEEAIKRYAETYPRFFSKMVDEIIFWYREYVKHDTEDSFYKKSLTSQDISNACLSIEVLNDKIQALTGKCLLVRSALRDEESNKAYFDEFIEVILNECSDLELPEVIYK